MRAIVLIAAWCIADAISKDWVGTSAEFLTWIFIIAIIMDIVEYFNNLIKK